MLDFHRKETVMTNHNDNDTQRNLAFLQLSASPAQETFPSFASQSAGGNNFRTAEKYPQNPRKKRTKLIRIDNPIAIAVSSSSSGGVGVAKTKYNGKKPDPSAPKITRPCTECGRKFWSWKALFGHMRCHPERQWRGINPPPNFRRPVSPENDVEAGMTQEDHEVAACLLMLANAPRAFETQGEGVNNTVANATNRSLLESDAVVRDAEAGGDDVDWAGHLGVNYRFECSSCKKVFGSHQALGGHRASHKNVKGCFAITRSDGEEVVLDHNGGRVDDRCCEGEVIRDCGEERMAMVSGHKCSICLKVFSSGQALGGHKRCHWERGDEPSSLAQGLNLNPFGGASGSFGLDLNLPAPVEDDLSSSYSSGLVLDLRLGI